jgi:microcystin degradation protein MlrC
VVAIVDAVGHGCDAILLDLHGAMVTESLEDGEGKLLGRIRAVAPDVPVGVALDLHGNITERMVANADVLVGFKTYPHVDMAETGAPMWPGSSGACLMSGSHRSGRGAIRRNWLIP